jgi:hypothetical protein
MSPFVGHVYNNYLKTGYCCGIYEPMQTVCDIKRCCACCPVSRACGGVAWRSAAGGYWICRLDPGKGAVEEMLNPIQNNV